MMVLLWENWMFHVLLNHKLHQWYRLNKWNRSLSRRSSRKITIKWLTWNNIEVWYTSSFKENREKIGESWNIIGEYLIGCSIDILETVLKQGFVCFIISVVIAKSNNFFQLSNWARMLWKVDCKFCEQARRLQFNRLRDIDNTSISKHIRDLR